ncbi:PAS domain-containing protein [Aliamphritea spongicola]
MFRALTVCDTFPDTEFYTAMLNHSSDGLCLIDRKEGTVRLVNEPLCQLLNRVSDSLKGSLSGLFSAMTGPVSRIPVRCNTWEGSSHFHWK